MNPASNMSAGSNLWQEARNADGRVYYYNVQTKATQWAKPAELMTPVEVRTCDLAHLLSPWILLTRYLNSAHFRISLGRNILQRVDGNIGTIQKASKVLGRSPKFTKMHLHRPNLLQRRPQGRVYSEQKKNSLYKLS